MVCPLAGQTILPVAAGRLLKGYVVAWKGGKCFPQRLYSRKWN